MGNTKGFTLPELIVAIVVGSIISATFLSISLFFYADIMRGRAETTMLIESQTILNQVSEDFKRASNALTGNNLSDVNEPTGGWTTSNENHILILQTPVIGSSTGRFVINDTTGEFYQNEIVYFADDENLYKRVIANPLAPDNSTRTTCPDEFSSATCPSDPYFSEDFIDMNFVFYDQEGQITTDITLARAVDIDIELEKVLFGETVAITNEIRSTLRNPNVE